MNGLNEFNLNFVFRWFFFVVVVVCLFFGFFWCWILRRTNTVKGLYGDFLVSFTSAGRPQVPLRALFQTRAGTWIEPPTWVASSHERIPRPWWDSNPQRCWTSDFNQSLHVNQKSIKYYSSYIHIGILFAELTKTVPSLHMHRYLCYK